MTLSCVSLAADVQALCGRTDDNALVTTTRIMHWFNEAQKDIVNRIPGLHAVTFKNTTSLDTTASLAYALGDITAGDYTTQPVAHVWNVFFLDGNSSVRLAFVHTDEFDAHWIDPTNDAADFGKPKHWTRRGNNIEIRPVCDSAYYDYDLRVDGDFYPRDFTAADTTRYSDLSDVEEGLVHYALANAWRAIGNADGVGGALAKAADFSHKYEDWLDGYAARNDRLSEWDGNLYSDEVL